ncbi:MAG: type II toxin-antitoxin system HicA family toxin [Candidatus Dependentiae bacterium]|nr:type II toxin-antitoxin system HicA family toxin [Candidatus Dependentiae bacterium]
MSSRGKLIKRILSGDKNVSFKEAESLLLWLAFEVKVSGSHQVFRKVGVACTVSLKKRPLLLAYQVGDVREVLIKYGYEKT